MEFLLNYGEPKSEIDRKIKRALRAKPEDLHKKHSEYNMSNLISPYYVNPYQKRMLQDIIGTKNVKDIEMLNALVYAGILNVDCPPRGYNEYSEKYIDPITGKIQCRRPQSSKKIASAQEELELKYPRPALPGKEFRCPMPGDSPFAFEAYVDDMGHPKCRPPVVRGDFSCPKGEVRDNVDHMGLYEMGEHKTLHDGTGICTEYDTLRSPGMYPDSVVPGVNDAYMVYGTTMYEKIKNYVNMFDDLGMNVNMINDLNSVLKSSKYVGDFRDKIVKKPSLAPLFGIIKNINTDDDLRIANTALYELMKSTHSDYMKQHNVTYGGFMGMTGGAKTRKKNSVRRKHSSRKKKSISKRRSSRKKKNVSKRYSKGRSRRRKSRY